MTRKKFRHNEYAIKYNLDCKNLVTVHKYSTYDIYFLDKIRKILIKTQFYFGIMQFNEYTPLITVLMKFVVKKFHFCKSVFFFSFIVKYVKKYFSV